MKIKKRSKQLKNKASFIDLNPQNDDFKKSVLEGFTTKEKSLNPKFFYDEYGSNLFTKITNTPEYYPTRTEIALLKDNSKEISSLIQKGSELIEFGAGSGEKVGILLKNINQFKTCVAIDISGEYLQDSVKKLAQNFNNLNVIGIHADYSKPIKLPPLRKNVSGIRVGFFPGSTIGNMSPPEAKNLLEGMCETLGDGALFLIGVDLKKDHKMLNAAYNDSKGLTAEFNKNILRRINRELEGDFNLEKFSHVAFYNSQVGRMEMHLVSDSSQEVKIKGYKFLFKEGEKIHTENSYKYTNNEFQEICSKAGMKPVRQFTDKEGLFTVNLMKVSL
ncbi:MAG: L-histidine N(alpha)-methyltransferase [Sphingomonadales bacterium]